MKAWFTASHRVSRSALFIVGIMTMVAGYRAARNSPWLIESIGAGLVALAALVPWVKEVKVGKEGVSATMHDRDVETSTRLAEEPVSVGGAAEIPELVAEETEGLLASARLFLANQFVGDLLYQHTEGPFAGCDFRLYLYDDDKRRLVPAFEPKPDESVGWAPGQGATGAAWLLNEYVLVEGAQVYDGTYGLDASQQARFRELAAVAAMPVRNAAGDVIAVLTASTKDASNRMSTDEAFEQHTVLALLSSRVLVDLLHWCADE